MDGSGNVYVAKSFANDFISIWGIEKVMPDQSTTTIVSFLGATGGAIAA